MLTLTSPELLFKNQKVFQIPAKTAQKLNNEQRRVLIVFESDTELLHARLKEMTDKLISACKFRAEDAVYFNARTAKGSTLESLQKEFEPVAVLVFGQVELGKSFPKNQPGESDGIKVMYTEPLETIQTNNAEKTELWKALKKMFNV